MSSLSLLKQTAWLWTRESDSRRRWVMSWRRLAHYSRGSLKLTCTILSSQIRNEMAYHNIRSYPFDSADYDQDEAQLNDAIRVGSRLHMRLYHMILIVAWFCTAVPHPLRCCRKRTYRHRRWQASQRQKEQMGRHQRWKWATLRFHLSSQFLDEVGWQYLLSISFLHWCIFRYIVYSLLSKCCS